MASWRYFTRARASRSRPRLDTRLLDGRWRTGPLVARQVTLVALLIAPLLALAPLVALLLALLMIASLITLLVASLFAPTLLGFVLIVFLILILVVGPSGLRDNEGFVL